VAPAASRAGLRLRCRQPLTAAGVPIAKHATVPEACLDFAIRDNAILGVSHIGQFGNGARDNSAKANLNVRF